MFKSKFAEFGKDGKFKIAAPSENLSILDNYIDINMLEEILIARRKEMGIMPKEPIEEAPSKTQAEYVIEQRIKKVKEIKSDILGTATALRNILTEMRDKSVWNAQLMTSVMLSIARLEPKDKRNTSNVADKLSKPAINRLLNRVTHAVPVAEAASTQHMVSNKQVSALRLYLKAVHEQHIEADKVFLLKYVLILYLHDSPARQLCVDQLVPLDLLNTTSLLPGEVCSAIHRCGAAKTPDELESMSSRLEAYHAHMDEHTIEETHLIVRTLSRYKLIPQIFSLLARVRQSAAQQGNVETIELLSQALVKNVGKAYRAESMSELPKAEADYPEVRGASTHCGNHPSLIIFPLRGIRR